MAIAQFKDLCVDAADPRVLGEFYAAVAGLKYLALHDGDAQLEGPTQRHAVWVNAVPEPKTVKHRVHLDLHTRSLTDLEALGAIVLEPRDHWTIMADPEGGEFCAFVRDEVPAQRLYEVVVDCADPEAQARWWSTVLDGSCGHDDAHPWWWVDEIPGAPFGSLVFQPVPEPKQVKNRIHWDLTAVDVQPLVDAGATVLRKRDDEVRWTVMADPEGNEFCAFTG